MKETHRHREKPCGYQGGGGGGGMDLGFGIGRSKLLHLLIERINSKVLLYSSTGNYIRYPGINHSGKEYKKEWTCMCIPESLCCIAEINTML